VAHQIAGVEMLREGTGPILGEFAVVHLLVLKGLAAAQDQGIDRQLELVDQTRLHQTGDQGGAADDLHVLAPG
jgi:hypothetical protein